MGERTGAYGVLVGWGRRLIDLAEDRDRWLAVVNAVMNLMVP
jgi:hypothetical protein